MFCAFDDSQHECDPVDEQDLLWTGPLSQNEVSPECPGVQNTMPKRFAQKPGSESCAKGSRVLAGGNNPGPRPSQLQPTLIWTSNGPCLGGLRKAEASPKSWTFQDHTCSWLPRALRHSYPHRMCGTPPLLSTTHRDDDGDDDGEAADDHDATAAADNAHDATATLLIMLMMSCSSKR